jgi:glycosyltransferase involved in cell wall biosynthesis
MQAGRPVAPRRPNVLIVADVGFPYGAGASSRVFNYARGLQTAGARVKVICVEPSWGASTLNVAARGDYEGVPFEYTYGQTIRPSSFAHRRLLKIAKWPRFVLAARRWASEMGGLDAMLVYSRSLPWIAVAWLICRLLHATLLHEDCELPFVWKAETPSTRLKRWLYQRVAFRAFDGCLVISTYLEAYCRRYLRPGAGTLLVPILVDVAEVTPDTDEDGEPDDRIAYCGYMDHPEMQAVVGAFADLAQDFPGLRLQLIGGSLRPEAMPALLARLGDLGIADRVEVVGKVKREDLFCLLRRARILMLPRASAAFSQAGLPTKVGEYLATGRPVVVSAVGDLPLYLSDGVDAYLADSDAPHVFGDRLRDALLHPAEASKIGRRGRETAKRCFDPSTHGARILAFIADLRRFRAGEPARTSSEADGPTGDSP